MDKKTVFLIIDNNVDVLEKVGSHLNGPFEVHRVSTLEEAQVALRQEANERAGEKTPAIIGLSSAESENLPCHTQVGTPISWLKNPVALLFGDMTPSTENIVDGDVVSVERGFREIVKREIECRDGWITKSSDYNFLAIFNTVKKAADSALAIQREWTKISSSTLKLRESVHWGEVKTVQTQNLYDVSGASVLECVRAAEKANPGQIVISQQARKALGRCQDHTFEDLGRHQLKGTTIPTHLYDVKTNNAVTQRTAFAN